MSWKVELHDDYTREFAALPKATRLALVKEFGVLKEFGPQLGRPQVDHLKGSGYANMKELRIGVGKEIWRVAFAFDPKRTAILLVGGDKRGHEQRKFYRRLIATADRRYAEHIAHVNP